MIQSIINICRIPELRKKLGFTILMLIIYRIGFHVPIPGVSVEDVAKYFQSLGGQIGQLVNIAAILSGGNIRQSTIFGLGIMPYISASIVFTLLTNVVPSLERLQKEGEAGRRKINEYTRYAAVLLCFVQATFWLNMVGRPETTTTLVKGVGSFAGIGFFWFRAIVILSLTAGTIFLMWLGEQIDEYGLGNGISLIIMAGIIARMPGAVIWLVQNARLSFGAAGAEVGISKILFLIFAFVTVTTGVILITQGQRRIPIKHAKFVRGRRVFGGGMNYLPLRVNQGGVMPIIFASSLLMFPGIIFEQVAKNWNNGFTRFMQDAFRFDSLLRSLCYVGLIFFFAFFWTTVQFRPKEIADNLQEQGASIRGRRPSRAAKYLEQVMERITYVGAAFLAVIAIIPTVLVTVLEVPYNVTAFLGGTGLLICVSVVLDMVSRVEASLKQHEYSGLLGDGASIRGPR